MRSNIGVAAHAASHSSASSPAGAAGQPGGATAGLIAPNVGYVIGRADEKVYCIRADHPNLT